MGDSSSFWISKNRIMSKIVIYVKLVIVTVTLIVTPVAAGGDFTRYRDPDIKVSFAYPEKFKPESPAEQSTRFLVSWRTKKSRNVMATCFLKATPTVGDDAAARYQLKVNPEERVKSYMDFAKKAGRKPYLISQSSIIIDDLDGVYFVFKATSKSFDKTVTMDLHHIVTFWDGYQIMLACGTALPYQLVDQAPEEIIDKVVKNVEAEIMKVLRTLHFDRN